MSVRGRTSRLTRFSALRQSRTATRGGPTVRNTNRLENGDVGPYALMWRDVSGEVTCSLTYQIEVGNKRGSSRPSMVVLVADVAGPSEHEVAG